MTKEELKQMFYHTISPICRYVAIQHIDGEWIDICRYKDTEEVARECCPEKCKYLKEIISVIKDKKLI